MDEKDLMHWFENCGHEITLFQSNKSKELTGVAVCKITNDVFRASGKDACEVLYDLKCMLNGVYFK